MNSVVRRFFVPEVVQTSAMDCGPASLKCLLEGMGIPVSYGRLREACQTDVDGTSIDTLEQLARQADLKAEQIMIPLDHLFLPEAQTLPAIVVVRLPNGFMHFVVAWRVHSNRVVQVMDPATGRRWPSLRQFLSTVYRHSFTVPANAWREWAGSVAFLDPLRRRLGSLGLTVVQTNDLIEQSLADSGWYTLASLDATTRMVTAIVQAGGIRSGFQTHQVLQSFLSKTLNLSPTDPPIIPSTYWFVRPSDESPTNLNLYGAVLIAIRGVTSQADSTYSSSRSPELVAALTEPKTKPWAELWQLVQTVNMVELVALFITLLLTAGGVVVEGFLFRSFIQVGQILQTGSQRLGAMMVLLFFVGLMVLLQIRLISTVLKWGRGLEAQLRMAFLRKIPRLRDAYFRSRPTSDMAQRSHQVHKLHASPTLFHNLFSATCTLLFTAVGIIWLSPVTTPLVILSTLSAFGLPLLALWVLGEQDLRLRTHEGALSRFFLDALLGLTAIRTHRAERSIRREHETLLVEWARAGYQLFRFVMVFEGLHGLVGFLLAGGIILLHWYTLGVGSGTILLLAYWALNLPTLGKEIADQVREFASHRNIALRLLEPLGALEDEVPEESASSTSGTTAEDRNCSGVAICMSGVHVMVAGHTILREIDLQIDPGTHVAIVGPSGAGKSTLVSLLLGWHRPAYGQLLVDHEPLDTNCLNQLRQVTAWVDPAVQLWNQPLLANLRYGTSAYSRKPLAQVIEQTELLAVLQKLPEGWQTSLGEGGGLVSGGEGQRVRLGRALLRPGIRLVILDEPFRGLDRQQRQQLLQRVRQLWADVTLLCITHDVQETQEFNRVVVMERGRIVEDGPPSELAGKPESRYRALLNAEQAIWQNLWLKRTWRHFRLERGQIIEDYS
jgi:ATP-binding cassette subfamily B protein